MKYVKIPSPVAVEMAQCSGQLKTLEGLVAFDTGDAILTGAKGERWPIRRKTFEANYEPVLPTVMGQNGRYVKRFVVVEAAQVGERCEIELEGGRGVLVANAGDWIVNAPDGARWVVNDELFRLTYRLFSFEENRSDTC